MGEIRLDNCCRLCLKEGFSLTNIFSHHSAAGDPLYRILNFIYDIKIFENDGFPSQICSPCMWRMIEFDACKKNVRSAEAEIIKLISKTRPDGASQVEVGIECKHVNSDVPIKEEVDIVDWEMPEDTAMKVPKAVQHSQEADEDDYHELESTEVEPVEVSAEEYEKKCYETVFCQPLRECSGLSEFKEPLHLEHNQEAIEDSSAEDSNCGFSCLNVIGDTIKEIPEGDEVLLNTSAMKTENNENAAELEINDSSIPLHDSNNKYVCDICKKGFQYKGHIARHVMIHYDERPFICDACGQSFKQKYGMIRHKLRHLKDKMSVRKSKKESKDKVFSCGICDKTFNTKERFYAHYNQHSKRYACSSCGKNFGSNFDLKRHFRIHTKEMPFKCDVCLKSFNRKDTLQKHKASHSSERPFSCPVCEITFKRKCELNRHELLHLIKK